MFRKPWTCKQVEPYFPPLSLHSQDQVLAQSIQKPLPCGKQGSLLTENSQMPFGAIVCYDDCLPVASKYVNFILI